MPLLLVFFLKKLYQSCPLSPENGTKDALVKNLG